MSSQMPVEPVVNQLNEETDHLFTIASKAFAAELLSFLAWRLPLISVFSISLIFILAVLNNLRDLYFASSWFLFALVIILLNVRLFWQSDLRSVWISSLLVFLSALGCWSLLVIFEIGGRLFPELLFLGLVLASGGLPWSRKYNVFLFIVFLCLTIIQVVAFGYGLNFLFVALILALTMVRFSAIRHHEILSRVLFGILSQACEIFSSAKTIVRLLARLTFLSADSTSALLIFGTDQAEVVDSNGITASKVDRIFVLGLEQQLESRNVAEAIFASDVLGEQFNTALYDWFGFLPRWLMFFKLRAVLDNREEKVFLVVPCTLGTTFSGLPRALQTLKAMVAVVRMALSAARGRFISSDALSLTEQSLTEREHEISQLIHTVNNVAQEVTVRCEKLREILVDDVPKIDSLKGEIGLVEGSMRRLAYGVSDINWLRELKRTSVVAKLEKVSLTSLLEEILSFGHDYVSNKKLTWKAELSDAKGFSLKVASREFLEASLRLMIRQACMSAPAASEVTFKVSQHGEQICFSVTDRGKQIDRETLKSTFAAVFNFAKLSGGRLDLRRGESVTGSGPAENLVELLVQFERYTETSKVAVSAQWILFVDDKKDITTFYGHVAQALKLDCSVAHDVTEARAILESRGAPSLLVTDIQLGNQSGLDLVIWFRSKFDHIIPVVVVSGLNEVGISERALSVGATKFLTKPVGRRRLFSEVKELLRL